MDETEEEATATGCFRNAERMPNDLLTSVAQHTRKDPDPLGTVHLLGIDALGALRSPQGVRSRSTGRR